ncbi:MAG: TatD family hydrolase [Chloroflexota bacterium]
MYPLTDTHCHLYFNTFDHDRAAVLDRACQVGVYRILVPGIDLPSFDAAVELADSSPNVFIALGVHPNSSQTWDDRTGRTLRSLVKHPKVVAIGEIGLDYYRQRALQETQQDVLREQLELAAECELPVIIHNRQAAQELLGILSEWLAELQAQGSPLAGRPGVLHSFSGTLEFAHQAIELGFFLGISGPVTFTNARNLQQVVAQLPLDKLFIETDAPFLTPHPYRGKRNEPTHVVLIADKISQLQRQPLEVVAQRTTENANELFSWGEPH